MATTTDRETDQAVPTDAEQDRAEAVRQMQKREAWRRRLPLLPALLFTIVVTQVPFLFSLYQCIN